MLAEVTPGRILISKSIPCPPGWRMLAEVTPGRILISKYVPCPMLAEVTPGKVLTRKCVLRRKYIWKYVLTRKYVLKSNTSQGTVLVNKSVVTLHPTGCLALAEGTQGGSPSASGLEACAVQRPRVFVR